MLGTQACYPLFSGLSLRSLFSQLRYFLLREIVFGQDGSFSFDAVVQRYNADLANGLGNLASRTLTMITRYFKGEIPYPSHTAAHTAADDTIAAAARKAIAESSAGRLPGANRSCHAPLVRIS